MKYFKQFLETLVMIAIALVIVFTFVEDLASYLMWDWNIRKILVYTGFGFDLFFTIEFTVRFIASLIKGDTSEYMMYRRGWVDFVASVPLLAFNSGPTVYFLISGAAFAGAGGVLNVLKVVKAVRVARILRMLRVLKIFRSIKSVDSLMTQRHMTRIISTVVVTVIAVMFFGSLIFTDNFLSSPAMKIQDNTPDQIAAYINGTAGKREDINGLVRTQSDILIVRYDGQTLFSRYSNSQYGADFGPADFEYVKKGKAEVFFDLRYENARDALPEMLLLLIIVITVVVIMLLYSPHFAMTVSDPVFVMLKGMLDRNYNLEVDIPVRYSDDDIFRLSAEYNDKYLTMKAREEDDENESEGALKLEDLGDLSDLLG